MVLSATYPELRRTLVEASEALARLDADRLEEMALSCEALVSGGEQRDGSGCELNCAASDTARELSILGRVIDATKTNLTVLRSLRDRKCARLEYGPLPAGAVSTVEGRHGDH
jgi:hypothetical protein